MRGLFVRKKKKLRVDMKLRGRPPLYGLPRNKATLDIGALMLSLKLLMFKLHANEVALPPHCCRIACQWVYSRHNGSFHPAYLVKKLEQGFLGRSIELVVSTRTPQVMINPQPYYKKSGRRHKQRIGSSDNSKSGATYNCRYCFQAGHNKITCM